MTRSALQSRSSRSKFVPPLLHSLPFPATACHNASALHYLAMVDLWARRPITMHVAHLFDVFLQLRKNCHNSAHE